MPTYIHFLYSRIQELYICDLLSAIFLTHFYFDLFSFLFYSIRFLSILQVHVKFVPLGVIGAIVPWNYPLHNVFNPLIATLMTGNALVLKVIK